ncbi:MAG: hypothetical protein NVSMB3_01690 [Acidobacteriaceae bacterium]
MHAPRLASLLGLLLVAASGLTQTSQTPLPPPVQGNSAQLPDPAMAERVKQQYLHAWNSYRKNAWGHDELNPLSLKPHDWYGVSLHMTQIDGLDTMLLMGLQQQAQETTDDLDRNLSFDQDIYVKNFEITIRCLGGLLSSYEMTGDRRLLDLAEDLGKRLLPAFQSPTGLPYEFVNLKTGKVRGAVTNPAEIALLPEFGTLGRLTGKPIYYDTAKRAMTELWKRRSSLDLLGSSINVETGQWVDPTSTISGGTDSFYEYALKSALLFGDKDLDAIWKSSIAAVNRRLAEDVRSGLWYGQFDLHTGKRISQNYGSLDAFFPALLVLGGDLDHAERLQRSNFQMWTLYGIEPELLNYASLQVTNPAYHLRPEIIESTYYLYHATADPLYQQMGRTYYDSLEKWCRTPSAYAELSDVRSKTQVDDMESFFFAETLKYLYLLYAPPQTVDWHKIIFNTEAHPLTIFR